MADIQLFREKIRAAKDYPLNLVGVNKHGDYLSKLAGQLADNQTRLFSPEGSAKVDLLERQHVDRACQPVQRTSLLGLQEWLHKGLDDPISKHPDCRFTFFEAKHSRAPLNVTLDMFLECLNYDQAMPESLDYIFPFGRQTYSREFQFGGIRHRSRLTDVDRGLVARPIGRTGYNIELCYSFQSVEYAKNAMNIPWSIRRMSAQCTFDIETGRTSWIMIKANDLIRRRIEKTGFTVAATDQVATPASILTGSLENFLKIHLLLCEWSAEDWRWYINWLEGSFQDETRELFSPSALDPGYTPPKISDDASNIRVVTRMDTLKSIFPKVKRRFTWRQRDQMISGSTDFPMVPPIDHEASVRATDDSKQALFTAEDLQEIQYMEERVNEARSVTTVNMGVYQGLVQCFESTSNRADCPEDLRTACNSVLPGFVRRMNEIMAEVQSHATRLDALLRMVGDRKSLLNKILEHHVMQTNQRLALEAQESAEKMTQMTEEMRVSARKTENETVSMKVITLVTLAFLPGTFVSTLMSTDIIHFNKTTDGDIERVYSSQALILFAKISFPIMVATFLAWLVVYNWVKRKPLDRFRRKPSGDNIA